MNEYFEAEIARGTAAATALCAHVARMGAGACHLKIDGPDGRLSVIVCPDYTWSRDTPTKPGWYFLRRTGHPDVVVRLISDPLANGLLRVSFTGYQNDATRAVSGFLPRFTRWAGPILPPEGGDDKIPQPGELL